ncbi:MAG: metal-dependent transcriptional regulator [Oscillospiraceae bacterium]|jgi:Mn-dependent DtxR family transcriptional regulator|nr:metal-dependent transcriptional regulator [Oscillospiraceae bacterium]
MEKLTATMEGYLETIHALCRREGHARLTDIAARLSVSKATANRAVSVLSGLGLVEGERYRELSLTERGALMACRICGKHYSLERFLVEVLEVPPDVAEKDACAVEHILSDESLDAIRRYLKAHVKEVVETP